MKPDLKLIKPSDGTMLDPKEDVGEFAGIEGYVKPEHFYNLLSLSKTDKFESHRTSLTISNSDYVRMEQIRTKLIRAKKSSMTRGLVGLGVAAASNHKNICSKKLAYLFKINEGCREKENLLKFNNSLDRLDFQNNNIRNSLIPFVKSFGKNKYGQIIWSRLYDSWNMPKLVFNKNADNLNIHSKLKSNCIQSVKCSLSRKMFDLPIVKRGNQETNKKLDLYVSERISIIIHEYLLNDPDDNLSSHFHRAFFIIGLYCLSKWIATSKICKDEFGYYVLLNKIDSLAAET